MTVDIREPVAEIFARLALEPADVHSFYLIPGIAFVVIYRRDRHGKKFLEYGEPALEPLLFEIEATA